MKRQRAKRWLEEASQDRRAAALGRVLAVADRFAETRARAASVCSGYGCARRITIRAPPGSDRAVRASDGGVTDCRPAAARLEDHHRPRACRSRRRYRACGFQSGGGTEPGVTAFSHSAAKTLLLPPPAAPGRRGGERDHRDILVASTAASPLAPLALPSCQGLSQARIEDDDRARQAAPRPAGSRIRSSIQRASRGRPGRLELRLRCRPGSLRLAGALQSACAGIADHGMGAAHVACRAEGRRRPVAPSPPWLAFSATTSTSTRPRAGSRRHRARRLAASVEPARRCWNYTMTRATLAGRLSRAA